MSNKLLDEHYTYFNDLKDSYGNVILDPDSAKIATAIILGLALVIIGCILKRRLNSNLKIENEVIPTGKFSCFSFFDFFIEKFIAFYDSVVGDKERAHLPFIATVFMFILFSNLLGLVPGVPAITSTVQINVALAVVTFIYFNYQGVKTHGFLGYMKHFCGPMLALAWFMFPLEIFSTSLRILTLNLRLYWNITADHLMLSIVTDNVVSYIVPALLYILGIFVSFMQAFVFTTLNMVYIKLATEHEGGHDDDAHEATSHVA